MDDIVLMIQHVMQTAGSIAEDLRLAHHYIAQLGDVWTFIQTTMTGAWSEASRINDAFGRSR